MRLRNYDSDVTTIGLIQGDALGGGFEMALANDFIVAEEGARMGFPEILFNLFPGMGALSLLARKIGLIPAKKIVTEGRIYTAETLFSLGVVDAVVKKGDGEKFIRDYIQRNEKRWNGLQAIRTSCQVIDPIQKPELVNIANIWVDAALKLNPKDLSTMEKLTLTQKKRFSPLENIVIEKEFLEVAI
jgi:DSF synthase